ncbi:hypothetical protein BC943DRAFT_105309 [Umbelopsis sp. AD052]|nr:hypothetical protein BC943DRAFT_105309 [Umbelopsis sp. AD052]
MRVCYYELLNVARTASPEELKKAYRKQALIWHPDKNADRIQQATDQFALIQEAYEVLSDPQERVWYDGHRDAILRGEDSAGQRDSSAGTTVDDLMGYFSISQYRGYNDDPKGFFHVYRTLFQKLEDEEEEAVASGASDEVHSFTRYPSFGSSSTLFADDDGYLGYGAYVKDFYNAWMTFSSAKSFQWADKWRLSEAPNRFVKRAMEKENKKARETAKKEYNDTIRNLVAFVRKRDPRYKAYQEQQKAKKDAQLAENKARAQRERLELQAKAAAYKEQEWARVGEEADSVSEDEDEDEDETGDFDDAFYCVACNKYFKSQRQFENHEQSKKHIKIVQDLREQMLADEENLDLQAIPLQVDDIEEDEVIEQVDSVDVGDDMVPIQKEPVDVGSDDDDEYIPMHPSPKKSKKKAKKKVPNWGFDSEEISESTTPNLDEAFIEEDLSTLAARLALGQSSRRKKGSRVNTPRRLDSDDENGLSAAKLDGDIGSVNSSNSEATPVKESAKAKREKRKEKKKQKEEAAAAEQGLNCNVCGEDFPTRNSLFTHIKSTGHALAAAPSKSNRRR